jgi:hypothetical protein
MDLIEKFSPKNLRHIRSTELINLTKEEIEKLAVAYPFMNGDLRIQKSDGKGVISSGTYRSVNSLIKSGHHFKIVGTKFGDPKIELQKEVEVIEQKEFIEPQKPIFNEPEKFEKLVKTPKKTRKQ